MSHVKPIPEGYHSITPYIMVNDVEGALLFYKRAFGAEELYRLVVEPGVIVHAEFKIGDSIMMISGLNPESHLFSESPTGRSVSFMFYVENVDKAAERAVSAGAKVIKEVQNQYWGDRTGTFEDPFGHVWTIGSHIEDVSLDEVKRRMSSMFGGDKNESKGHNDQRPDMLSSNVEPEISSTIDG